MIRIEDVEKLLAELRREREEAEAEAVGAADSLVRLASRLSPLDQIDADQVEAAADDFAAAVRRLKLLERVAARLRSLTT